MAYKIVITNSAREEYLSILDYFDKILQDCSALKNFKLEFLKIRELILDNPKLFSLSKFTNLRKLGYRKANVNNYLILYKIVGQTIYFVHIFHQNQDYANLV